MRLFPATPPSKPKSAGSTRSPRRKKLAASRDSVSPQRSNHHTEETSVSATDGMIILEYTVQKKDRRLSFVIREFPRTARFFSIDIVVLKTNQKWCVFVPVTGNFDELLRIWSITPKYENKRALGEWLLRVTKLEFSGDTITGAVFDTPALHEKCVQEMTKLAHIFATKIQAIYRTYRIRKIYSKIGHWDGDESSKRKFPASSLSSSAKYSIKSHPHTRKYPTSPRRPIIPSEDIRTYRSLRFTGSDGDDTWENSPTLRSSTAGAVPRRHKPERKTMYRVSRSPDREEYVHSKLMMVAGAYTHPPTEKKVTPPAAKKRAAMLKELQNLKTEMSGALEAIEVELEQFKMDCGRSIHSMRSTLVTDRVESTGAIENITSPNEDSIFLKMEISQLQQEINKLSTELNKHQKVNLINPKLEVNPEDPVQCSAWTCIQQALTRYARRRRFRHRVYYLVRVINGATGGDLIREALRKSVESGSVILANCVTSRIIDIVRRLGHEENNHISNYKPTNQIDVRMICNTLISFISIRTIIQNGLEVFNVISSLPKIFGMVDMLGEAGVCDFVLLVLRRHTESADITFNALKLYLCLVCDSILNKERMSSPECCEVLGRAMTRHCRDDSVVEKSVMVLCELTRDYSVEIFDTFKLTRLCSCVISCLQVQHKNSGIVFVICRAISTLTSSSYYLKEFFASGDCFKLYIDCLLENYGDEKCYQEVAVMITSICEKNASVWATVSTEYVAVSLHSILRLPDVSEEVVKITVTLIYKLCTLESLRLLFLSKGVDKILLDLCDRSFASSTVSGIQQARFRLLNRSLTLSVHTGTTDCQDASFKPVHLSHRQRYPPMTATQQPIRTPQVRFIGDGTWSTAEQKAAVIIGRSLWKVAKRSVFGASTSETIESVQSCNDTLQLLRYLRLCVVTGNVELARITMERIKCIIEHDKVGTIQLQIELLRKLKHLFDVMLAFLSIADVQIYGLEVMKLLPHDASSIALAGTSGACNLVFAVLKRHMENVTLCRMCLHFSCVLVNDSPENRQSMVEFDNCHILSELIGSHYNDASVTKESCHLIQHLCRDSLQCRDYMAVAGVSGQILDYLTANSRNEDIVGSCVRTIISLCGQLSERNCSILVSDQSLHIYSKLLLNNVADAGICRHICKLLAEFCGNEYKPLTERLVKSNLASDLCNVVDKLRKDRSVATESVHSVLTLVACLLYNCNDFKERFRDAGLSDHITYFLSGWTRNIVRVAKVISGYLSSVKGSLASVSSTSGRTEFNEFDRARASVCITRNISRHHQQRKLGLARAKSCTLLRNISIAQDAEIITDGLRTSVLAGDDKLALESLKRVNALTDSNGSGNVDSPIAKYIRRNPVLMLDVLFAFLSFPKIQKLGLATLQRLFVSNRDIERVGTAGACVLAYRVLHRHRMNSDLCGLYLSYGLTLCRPSAANRKLLGSIDSCRVLKNLMVANSENSDIMSAVCSLVRVATDSLECRDNVFNAGITCLLLDYLDSNSQDTVIVGFCVRTMLFLCAQNHSHSWDVLVSDLAVRKYCHILCGASTTSVHKDMCMLLVGLTKYDTGRTCDLLTRNDFPSKMATLLKSLISHDFVVSTLMLVVHFTIQCPSMRIALLKADMLSALRRFVGSAWSYSIRKTATAGIHQLEQLELNDELSCTQHDEEISELSHIERQTKAGRTIATAITRFARARRKQCEIIKAGRQLQECLHSISKANDVTLIFDSLKLSLNVGSCIHVSNSLSRLQYLCETKNVDIVDVNRNVEIILDVMSSFLSRTDIQQCGFSILQHLPCHEEDVKRIGELKGCELLRYILQRHRLDSSVCVTALRYGCRLTCECAENQYLMCNSKMCEVLSSLMTTHSLNISLMNSTNTLISNLCKNSQENRALMCRCGICGHVLKCLVNHSRNEEVCRLCAGTITSLCTENDMNRAIFGSSQSIAIYFQVIIDNDKNPQICKVMCNLLQSMCRDGRGIVEEELCQSGIACEIASFLSAHEAILHPDIAQAVLMLAVHFAVNIPELRSELLSAGMVEVFKLYSSKKWSDKIRKAAIRACKSISPQENILKCQKDLELASKEDQEAANKIARAAYMHVQYKREREKFSENRTKLEYHINHVGAYSDCATLSQCLQFSVECSSTVLASKTFARLRVLCTEGETEISLDFLKLILDTMVVFLSRTDVQRSGLSILQQSTGDSSQYEIIGRLGACDVVNLILLRHSSDTSLCTSCASYAANLICGSPKNIPLLCSQKSCEILSRIMKANFVNTKLMHHICVIVSELSTYSAAFREMLGCSGVCECLVSFLRANPGDEYCVGLCTKTILSLCVGEHPNIVAFSSRECLHIYSNILTESRSNPKICKHMCMLLATVCGNGEGMVSESLCGCRIAAVIAKFLSDDDGELSSDAAQAVLMLAVHFAVNVPVMRSELLSAGMVEVFKSYSSKKWADKIRKAAMLGIRKISPSVTPIKTAHELKEEAALQESAAKIITRSVNYHIAVKRKKEIINKVKAGRQYHLSQIASCCNADSILNYVDLSVECGDHQLASKAMSRLVDITRKCSSEVQERIITRMRIILGGMFSFLSISSVQRNGLTLIHHVSPYGVDVAGILGEHCGCDLVHGILRRHVSDYMLCTSALHLWCALLDNCSAYRIPMCSPRSCEIIANLMKTHHARTTVVNQVCELISKLSSYSSSNRDVLGQCGVCGFVITYLMNNVENEAACEACISAISSLCREYHEQNRLILGSSKHISLYVEVIRANVQNSKIVHLMSNIIEMVCDRNDAFAAKEVFESGVTMELSNILRISEEIEQDSLPLETAEALVVLVAFILVNCPITRPQFASVGMSYILEQYTCDKWNDVTINFAKLGIGKLYGHRTSNVSADLKCGSLNSFRNSRNMVEEDRTIEKCVIGSSSPDAYSFAEQSQSVCDDNDFHGGDLMRSTSAIYHIFGIDSTVTSEFEDCHSSGIENCAILNADEVVGLGDSEKELLVAVNAATEEKVMEYLRLAVTSGNSKLGEWAVVRAHHLSSEKMNSCILSKPRVLLDVMSAFLGLTNTIIASKGLSILRRLSFGPGDTTSIGNAGGFEVISAILQIHSSSSELCMACIDFGIQLAEECVQNRIQMVKEGVCEAIVCVRNTHKNRNDIVGRCFVFVSVLCAGCSLAQRRFGDVNIHDHVIKHLLTNIPDEAVVHMCANTIISLCEDRNTECFKVLAAAKNLRLYFNIIRKSLSNISICSDMIRVLSALCEEGGAVINKELCESGIGTMLASVLFGEKVGLVADIQEGFVLLTVHIATHIPIIRPELTASGMINILQQYTTNEWGRQIRTKAREGIELLLAGVDLVTTSVEVTDDEQLVLESLQLAARGSNYNLAMKTVSKIIMLLSPLDGNVRSLPLGWALLKNPNFVVDAINAYKDSTELVEKGLSILRKLPYSPNDYSRVGAAGCNNVVCSVLRAHVSDRDVCGTALIYGMTLTAQSLVNRVHMGNEGICEIVLEACRAHKLESTVMDKCFGIMSTLCADCPQNQSRLGEGQICDVFIKHLVAHIDNSEIIRTCTHAIIALCNRHNDNRKLFASEKFILLCIHVIKTNRTSLDVCTSMCTVMTNLFGCTDEIDLILCQSGIAQELYEVLTDKDDNKLAAGVACEILAMVAHFLQHVPCMRSEFAAAGMVSVLNMYQTRGNDMRTRESADIGMHYLTSRIEFLLDIIDTCIEPNLICECLKVATGSRNVVLGLRAVHRIYNLTDCDDSSNPVNRELISTVLQYSSLLTSTMINFSLREDLQQKGIAILQRLHYGPGDVERVGSTGAVTAIRNIFQSYITNGTLCSECLAYGTKISSMSLGVRIEMGTEGICECVWNVCTTHKKDLKLVALCLRMFCALCTDCVDNQIRIGSVETCALVSALLNDNIHNEWMVGLCCHTIASLCSGSNEKICDHFIDGASLRKYAMIIQSNTDNAKICKHMCLLLLSLYGKGEGVDRALRESDLAAILTDILSTSGSGSTLTADIANTLVMFVVDFISNAPVMKKEFISAGLVSVLRRYTDDDFSDATRKAAHIGMKKLVPRIGVLIDSVQGTHSIKVIIEGLEVAMEYRCRDLAAKAMCRLSELLACVSTEDKNEENLLRREVLQTISVIIKVATEFIDAINVVESALDVIQQLSESSDDIRAIVSCGGFVLLRSILDTHASIATICSACLVYGTHTASDSIRNRIDMGKSGCCESLLGVCRAHENNVEMMRKCLHYMSVLCTDCPDNQDAFCSGGACGVVIKHLISNMAEVSDVSICAQTILSLCSNMHLGNRRVLISEKHMQLYIKVVRLSSHSSKICKIICALFVGLCGSSDSVTDEVLPVCGVATELRDMLSIENTEKLSSGVSQGLVMLVVHMAVKIPSMRPVLLSVGMTNVLRRFTLPEWNDVVRHAADTGIRKLIPRMAMLMDTLSESTDPSFLTECLQSAVECGYQPLAEKAIGVIEHMISRSNPKILSSISDIREVVCTPVLMDVLCTFWFNTKICDKCFSIITEYPYTSGDAEMIISLGGADKFRSLLEKFLTDSRYCPLSLSYGSALLSDSLSNKIAMGQHNICECAVLVCQMHANDAHIMTKGLSIICALSTECVENQRKFGREDFAEVVLTHLSRHKLDSLVVELCARTILSICAGGKCENHLHVFLLPSYIRVYFDVIRSSATNAKICKCMYSVVVVLCKNEKTNVIDSLRSSGIASDIASFLRFSIDAEKVREVVQLAVMLVVYLIVNYPSLAGDFIDVDMVNVLKLYISGIWSEKTKKAARTGISKLIAEASRVVTLDADRENPEPNSIVATLAMGFPTSDLSSDSLQSDSQSTDIPYLILCLEKAVVENSVDLALTSGLKIYELLSSQDVGPEELLAMVKATAKVIEKFIKNTDLCKLCLDLLSRTEHDSQMIETFHLAPIVASVLDTHQSDPSVCCACVDYGICLASIDVSVRLLFGEHGVCDCVLAVFRRHSNIAAVADRSLRFICALCRDCPSNQDKLGNGGACSCVIECLSEYITNSNVVISGTHAIASLCAGHGINNNRYTMTSTRPLQLYMEVIRMNPMSGDTCKGICSLLVALCGKGEGKVGEQMMDSGISDALLVMLSCTDSDRAFSIDVLTNLVMLVVHFVLNIPAMMFNLASVGMAGVLCEYTSAPWNETVRKAAAAGVKKLTSLESREPLTKPFIPHSVESNLATTDSSLRPESTLNQLPSIYPSSYQQDIGLPGSDDRRNNDHVLQPVHSNSMTSSDVSSLLSFVEIAANESDVDAVLHLFRRLRSMLLDSPNGKNISAIQEASGKKFVILHALASYLNNNELIKTGLEVMQIISLHIGDGESFSLTNEIDMICSILKQYVVDADICSACVKYCSVLVAEQKEICVNMGKAGVCNAVVDVMRAQLEKTRVVLCCLPLVRVLCNECDDNRNRFGECGLCSLVIKFMLPNLADEHIVSTSLQTVVALSANQNAINSKVLTSSSHFQLYIRVLRLHSTNPVICDCICTLMIALCRSDQEGVGADIVKSGIIRELAELLTRYVNRSHFDPEVTSAIVLLVVHFVVNVPMTVSECLSVGMIDVLRPYTTGDWNNKVQNAVNIAIQKLSSRDENICNTLRVILPEEQPGSRDMDVTEATNEGGAAVDTSQHTGFQEVAIPSELLSNISTSTDVLFLCECFRSAATNNNEVIADSCASRIRALVSGTGQINGNKVVKSLAAVRSELFAAFTEFLESDSVTSNGLFILHMLLSPSAETSAVVSNHEVMFVTSALQLNMFSSYCSLILECGTLLADSGEESRTRLCSNEMCKSVVQVLRTYQSNWDIMLKCFNLICALCRGDLVNRDKFGHSGVATEMIGYLRNNMANEVIVSNCHRVITVLCTECVLNREKFVADINLYVDIIKGNVKNARLVKGTCALLVVVCGKGEGSVGEEMIESSICQEFIRLLNDHASGDQLNRDVATSLLMLVVHFVVNIPILTPVLESAGTIDVLRRYTTSDWNDIVRKAASIAINKLSAFALSSWDKKSKEDFRSNSPGINSMETSEQDTKSISPVSNVPSTFPTASTVAHGPCKVDGVVADDERQMQPTGVGHDNSSGTAQSFDTGDNAPNACDVDNAKDNLRPESVPNRNETTIEVTDDTSHFQKEPATTKRDSVVAGVLSVLKVAVEERNLGKSMSSLKEIRSVMSDTDLSYRESYREGIYISQGLIISCLSLFSDNTSLVVVGLDVLRMISSNEISADEAKLLRVILQIHISNRVLCSRILLYATAQATKAVTNRIEMGKTGICEVVADVCARYKDDKEIVIWCLQYVVAMCTDCSSNEIISVQCIKNIVASLEVHKSCESTISTFAEGFIALCTGANSQILTFFSTSPTLELIFKVLKCNGGSVTVCKSLCSFLVLLFDRGRTLINDNIQYVTVSKGIVDVLSDHNCTSTSEAATTVVMMAVYVVLTMPTMHPALVSVGVIDVFRRFTTNDWSSAVKKGCYVAIKKLSMLRIVSNASSVNDKQSESRVHRTDENEVVEEVPDAIDESSDTSHLLSYLGKAIDSNDLDLAMFSMRRILAIVSNSGDLKSENLLAVKEVASQVNTIFSVASVFIEDANVVTACLDVLQQLEYDDADIDAIDSSGKLGVISAILQEYVSDGAICLLCMDVAIRLAAESETIQLELGDKGICESVIEVCQAHENDNGVVEKCFRLVCELCDDCPENQDRFGHLSVSSHLVKYLIGNMKNESGVGICARTIMSLCADNHQHNRSVLVSRKHLRLYTHIIRKNCKNLKITRFVCTLLAGLFKTSDEYGDEELVESEIAYDLASLLSAYFEKSSLTKEVAQAVVILVAHFVINIPDMRYELVAAGMIKLLSRFSGSEWSSNVRKTVPVAIRMLEKV